MTNEKNLIPFSERSEEEAREFGRKGGIASGVARRRKRSLREAADLFLSMPVRDKRRLNAMLRDGINEEDVDNQMAIIVGLSKMAMAGDARAAKLIFDLLRESEMESGRGEEGNNLLDAIQNREEINTDDLPEVE